MERRDIGVMSRPQLYCVGVATSEWCRDMDFFFRIFPLVLTAFPVSQLLSLSHDFTCLGLLFLPQSMKLVMS